MTQEAQSVKVLIESKIGDAEHKASFEMKEVSELERVIIIQNIFKAIGVENDISQMIEDYSKIGKAYHSFFNKVDPIEAPSTTIPVLKSTDAEEGSLAEQISAKLKEKHDKEVNIEPVHYSKKKLAEEYQKAITEDKSEDISEDIPEHYRTGILEENGKTRYQCRLACTCGASKTHYIEKHITQVHCKNCGKRHKTRWAKRGYLEKDRNNNYFIAGKFVGEDEAQGGI